MLRKLFLAAAAACAVTAMCQTPVVELGNKHFTCDGPTKLDNNGRVLTEKGRAAIDYPDIASIRVNPNTPDTLFITLKPEALKRLDADKALFYEPLDKPKKGAKGAKKTE